MQSYKIELREVQKGVSLFPGLWPVDLVWCPGAPHHQGAGCSAFKAGGCAPGWVSFSCVGGIAPVPGHV